MDDFREPAHGGGGDVLLAEPLRPAATLCMACPVRRLCVGSLAAQAGTRQLLGMLAGRQRLRAGESLDPGFAAPGVLYAVHRGSFKLVAPDGTVRAFHFPGELAAAEGLGGVRDAGLLVALEDSELCGIRWTTGQGAESATYQARLWDMASREIVRERGQAAWLAQLAPLRRMAGFLAIVALRLRVHGAPVGELRVPLSHRDIGAYLRLREECVREALAELEQRQLVQHCGLALRIARPELLQREAQRASLRA